jgi:hypothetical protein
LGGSSGSPLTPKRWWCRHLHTELLDSIMSCSKYFGDWSRIAGGRNVRYQMACPDRTFLSLVSIFENLRILAGLVSEGAKGLDPIEEKRHSMNDFDSSHKLRIFSLEKHSTTAKTIAIRSEFCASESQLETFTASSRERSRVTWTRVLARRERDSSPRGDCDPTILITRAKTIGIRSCYL